MRKSKLTESIRNTAQKLKIVEWQIADKCNYHCSYCNAKIWQSNYPKLVDYKEFIRKLDELLGGNWLIHLGGYGEPFTQPNFLKIVKELIDRGYYIGLVSNFSYPLQDILRFCEITKGKLLYFNASLHLEFVRPESFLRKAIEIRKIIGPLFQVSAVGIKKRIPELIKIGKEFNKKNIKFIFQTEKIGEGYCSYPGTQIKEITKNFGYTYAINKENRFKNKKCFAGKDYFILDNNGEAYFCNPYRAACRGIANRSIQCGYLGNILDGTFALRKKNTICKLDVCSCSTPWRVRGWRNESAPRL